MFRYYYFIFQSINIEISKLSAYWKRTAYGHEPICVLGETVVDRPHPAGRNIGQHLKYKLFND